VKSILLEKEGHHANRTSRFTHLVGLSPRLLRQRAQAFEPLAGEPAERSLTISSGIPRKRTLLGQISATATFRGTIYVGLFSSPISQGRPVRYRPTPGDGIALAVNARRTAGQKESDRRSFFFSVCYDGQVRTWKEIR